MDRTHVNISVLDGAGSLSADGVSRLVEERFGDDAWCFVENPVDFVARHLPLPEGWEKRCLSLIVFDGKSELRAEPDGADRFACRLLVEGERPGEASSESGDAWVRRTTYLLRKHAVTASMYQEGYTHLVFKEFFKVDDDGMPRLRAAAFGGFESNKGEQK